MRALIKKYLTEEYQQSNFDKIIDSLGRELPNDILDKIREYVKSYIRQKGYTVKFLSSCYSGFAGVRTSKQIIICSPNQMSTLGDFIYTIFHELRHEEQISELHMGNPLSEYDLEDFEKLYEKYWEMEMDADRSAKEKVAEIIKMTNIPISVAKLNFTLSNHIENYQYLSNVVKSYLHSLVRDIKKMKSDGREFSDIQDHPMVKRHLDRLENFI